MHVNIVKFVDNFVENGVMHIVMEFATGGTLYKQLVNRDGELLEEAQVWEWFVQVCAPAEGCNGRGFPRHRALSPSPHERLLFFPRLSWP